MSDHFSVRQFCPACKAKNNITLLSIGYDDPKIKQFIKLSYPSFKIQYEYLKNNNYILNECNNCGLIYQKEIPNEFLITKIYNEWIDLKTVNDVHVKKKKIGSYIDQAKQIINIVKHFDATPCEMNILDFGMGLGAWCQLARGFGCNVHGTDISEDRMDYVKASGIQVIKFEDIQNYEFDFINSDQIFEHIAEPWETIIYLSKALKQNGIIKISVPNGMDIKKKLNTWDMEKQKNFENSINPFSEESEDSLLPVSPFEHINCYNYNALVNMAEKARLSPIIIPNRFIEVYNQKQEIKRLVRTLFSRCYHSLIPTKRRMDSTSLYFEKLI